MEGEREIERGMERDSNMGRGEEVMEREREGEGMER